MDFWLDEVPGANYTNRASLKPWWRCCGNSPLYYLQLNAWANLTHSDAGLLLNSVVWSLVSVVLVYAGVLRVAGGAAASIAALMLTVAGGEVLRERVAHVRSWRWEPTCLLYGWWPTAGWKAHPIVHLVR